MNIDFDTSQEIWEQQAEYEANISENKFTILEIIEPNACRVLDLVNT